MYLKGEKCSGGKNSKIRLTGLATANMCGEKIPTFVVGIKRTPCFYRAPEKSWMVSELFEEWFREYNRKFALEERKVALVIDNCTANPNTHFFYVSNLVPKTPDLNLGKKSSNLLSNHEALN